MKKKIIIITPEFPYPLTSGGKQAQYHMVNKLRDIYDISILFDASGLSDNIFDELRTKWPNVIFFSFKRKYLNSEKKTLKQKIYNKLSSVKNSLHQIIFAKSHTPKKSILNDDFKRFRSTLYNSGPIWYPADFLDYVYTISRKDFDIIQVEFYEFLPFIHLLPKNKKTIFIHHEIRYIRNELEMSLFDNKIVQDQFAHDIAKMCELSNLSLFDKIVTLSDIDKEKLKLELADKPIYSSPAMIESNPDTNIADFKFNKKLIFIGSQSHYPNADGLIWFLDKVWREIIIQNADLELHVIGDWSDFISQCQLNLPQIYVHSYIPNLNEILPNSIMIVPIRIGSGIRMKIIDAINYHIPFITTSIGVEGLDFQNNKDCLVADSPSDFINAVNNLTKDSNLQMKLIKEASCTMKKLYDEDYVIAQRIKVYES